MGFFRRSVLAFRVLQWVLLSSFALFGLTTSFGLVQEEKKAMEVAQREARHEVDQSLSAISNSLWQFDIAAIHALLAGIVASRVVVRAELLGPDSTLADVAQPNFNGTVDRVWTIPVVAQDQSTVLGTLRISESYDRVNAQVADTLRTLIVTDLVKIIGLALLLFAIVYRLVARHLRQLARDVTVLGISDDPQTLSVDRRKLGVYRDEIDILVEAINRFVAERAEEMRRRSAAEASWRNAERERARSEEKLAITLHSIGDGVIATDSAGLITRMNPTAERLTGWPIADALGKPLGEVFRIINAMTRKAQTDPVQLVMEHGQVVGLANHTILLSKEGLEYQISDSAAPILNASKEIVGVVLVFSDVTEKYAAQAALEESRERHRALSEGAFEAIFISENGICLEQNSQAQRMFGYTLEQAKGRAMTDWAAPADRALVTRNIRAGYDQPYEVRCLRQDGTIFPPLSTLA